MKRNSILTLILLLVCILTGCNKWDCNGDLDGMWQLLEWRDEAGSTRATKQDMVFYSFQLRMASFRKNKGEGLYVRSSIEVSSQQIRIFDPIEYAGDGHDAVLPMSALASVGVPDDGILWIETLTGSTMVLRTNKNDVLTFRKY